MSDAYGLSDQNNSLAEASVGRATSDPAPETRLATLQEYDILDTPDEREFDDITALASAICETPIALISLVDADRQWFKARHGTEMRQTSLECSICTHAIIENGFLEIRDTTRDKRTNQNPLVTGDEKLRFYAGAPLVTSNGLAIGTLCVLSREPRELTPLQRQTLLTLANQVMTQLELRRLLRIEETLRKEIDHRVKNSLQTVQSLIRLYANKTKDPTAVAAFAAVERRLDSIITLHAELNDTNSVERLGLAKYLDRVVTLLIQTLPEGVTVEQLIANINVSSSEATAVGVIVSEFVANSIKHAFSDGRTGQIRISARRDLEDHVVLVCEDDGKFMSVDAPAENDEIVSLGQKIMEASAAQIGGQLEIDDTPPGYRCTLRFMPVTKVFTAQPAE